MIWNIIIIISSSSSYNSSIVIIMITTTIIMIMMFLTMGCECTTFSDKATAQNSQQPPRLPLTQQVHQHVGLEAPGGRCQGPKASSFHPKTTQLLVALFMFYPRLIVVNSGSLWFYAGKPIINQLYLVGGWPTPLKNMSSSVGMMKFPIWWGK